MRNFPYYCTGCLCLTYLITQACSPPRPHENGPLGSVPSGSKPSDSAGEPQNTGGLNNGGTDNRGESSGGLAQNEGGSAGAPHTAPVVVPVVPLESACGSGPSKGLSFSKANLLSSAGECAMLRYCEFNEAAAALADAADDYFESPFSPEQALVQAAYQTAIQLWARAELFQVGPAASSMEDPVGGINLRDLIYPWPFVSRCRVEEQVLGKAYALEGFGNLVKVPINSRGLFAVEYLSFYAGADTACTQYSIANVDNAWNSTDSEKLNELKHDYLKAVTRDVSEKSQQLLDAWAPDGGNYLDKFASAKGYMNQQEALNLLAHSLLYIEVEVKDYKVGAPAGLYDDAPLERPEGSFSGRAQVLIQENLRGFRDLFFGCGGTGLGFDDWLVAAGHSELSEDIESALEQAEDAVRAFPELSQATTGDFAELHAVLKRLTDHLKTDFFGQGSPLGFTLPSSVEGDTD